MTNDESETQPFFMAWPPPMRKIASKNNADNFANDMIFSCNRCNELIILFSFLVAIVFEVDVLLVTTSIM